MIGFEGEINSAVYQDDLVRIVKKTNNTYAFIEETIPGTNQTQTVQVMTDKVDKIDFYQKELESFELIKEVRGAEEKYTDLIYDIVSRKIEKGDKKFGTD